MATAAKHLITLLRNLFWKGFNFILDPPAEAPKNPARHFSVALNQS
jgi:hypothetical protein